MRGRVRVKSNSQEGGSKMVDQKEPERISSQIHTKFIHTHGTIHSEEGQRPEQTPAQQEINISHKNGKKDETR